MKKIVTMAIVALALTLFATTGMAGKSSVEMGKKLFNDPTLSGSTNDRTCNSCHDNGSGLEKSGNNKKLAKIINRCIIGPLKGKKLDGRSIEMRSLKMYIHSLAG